MATDPSSPEPVHAYLATAGDLALPVRDANASADPHLVVVALLVSPGHHADTRARVDALRSAYAAGGPLSPTLLARTPALLREVVEGLAQLPFRIVGLAVDKREVGPRDSLLYGEPLPVFVSRLLARQLVSLEPAPVVHGTIHGADHLLTSFATYLERARPNARGPSQLDIFATPAAPLTVAHRTATQEPLLQAAGVVAAVIARALASSEGGEARALAALLAPRGTIDLWPTLRDDERGPLPAGSTDDDRAVLRLARDAAEAFFARHREEATPATRMRVATLKMLVYRQLVDPEGAFVPAGELEDHLLALGHEAPGKGRWIGRTVIAGLRDEGVLVASGPTGYRLPSALADLRAWVSWNESMIAPMVKRLAKVRAKVIAATGGRVDLLAGDAHATTRAAVDSELPRNDVPTEPEPPRDPPDPDSPRGPLLR